MSNLDNPHIAGTPQHDRFGAASPRPLKPYRAGETHADSGSMAIPDDVKKCVILGRAREVEFIIHPPAGAVSYTIVCGRWVQDTSNRKKGSGGINEWVEVKRVLGANDDLASVVFDTHTDAVGIYILSPTGTLTGGFTFFFRPL